MSPTNTSCLNNCIIDLRNWMTTISNKLSHFPTIDLDDTIIYPQYSTQ